MGTTIANEAHIFYASLICGVLCGLVFDVFRAFRRTVRTGAASVAIQDLFFWIILSGIVFAYMYKFNDGQPRLYIFIGMGIGIILYLLSASRYVIAALKKLFAFICLFLKFLLKIILFPIRILKKPFKILIVPLSKLNKRIAKFLFKIRLRTKKLKKVMKMY